MTKIIDGRKLADEILHKVTQKAQVLKDNHNKVAKIVTILVGNNSASEIYIKAKLQAAEKVGIIGQLVRFPGDITEEDFIAGLQKFNTDKTVTGILVQFPLPPHLNKNIVFDTLDSKKDIDAFGIYNTGLLNHNQADIMPCTPQGILYLLKQYFTDLTGKKVVVIGRSKIVGRPMAAILLNENCTVTQVHSKTKNVPAECARADIIIVAVGVAKFLRADWVKEGCFVVDVGINRDDGGLVGDTDFDNLLEKVSYITPVPGGVGPLTVANLMLNAMKLCYIQTQIDW
jgi:methylenetetrahydrofolate dehydrogenase (NADP+)/methenyltetrahydrofolate cyclohydrolase